MREIAEGAAQGLRCGIRFETTYGGPPVVNDPALTERAAAALTRAVGAAHVQKIAPIMPSEDFAWYQTRVRARCCCLARARPKGDELPAAPLQIQFR